VAKCNFPNPNFWAYGNVSENTKSSRQPVVCNSYGNNNGSKKQQSEVLIIQSISVGTNKEVSCKA